MTSTSTHETPIGPLTLTASETGLTRLPVVERAHPDRMVGTISLQDMLKARVRHLEEERRRERTLPLSFIVPRWLRSNAPVPSTRTPVAGAPGDGR